MKIVSHSDVPETRGYYSRIWNRKLLSGEEGVACEIWEQTIPVGGYIVAHRHAYAEVLTFLSGDAVIDSNGTTHEIGPGTTVRIDAGDVHAIRNRGDTPVRLLAFHLAPAAAVEYPDSTPPPVAW